MLSRPPKARRRAAPPNRSAPARGASVRTVIPYDYGVSFPISGRPGNVVQGVINIASDGVFVAVGIGYGFEEERGRPLLLRPTSLSDDETTLVPGDITLGQIPPEALIEGVRFNPRLAPMIFAGDSSNGDGRRGASIRERTFSDQPLSYELVRAPVDARVLQRPTLIERVKTPAEISFLLSIVDSGTGREMQDEPVHNIASLGKSDGERPFRLLAQPVTFQPRSSIRMQIIERSPDTIGTLFVVLYGYFLQSVSGCPEPPRALSGKPGCAGETIGAPGARVIPFDYVVTVPLIGQPRHVVESEVPISADDGFVATAIGYGLQVDETAVPVDLGRFPKTHKEDTIRDLNKLPLRALPPGALADGIRFRPSFLRIAFGANGALADQLPVTLLPELFERLNKPADVSFRYALSDTGRGRDFQNAPLHNIAGLGIATGDRPFKRLARPAVFLPRSTVHVRVEERFGRGTLFLVLQGYKLLSAQSGTRRV
jgi:hypothetical protein